MSQIQSKKSSSLEGKITVPGDKSISHRALMLAAQAVGVTKITGLLESEDVINTANALRQLGAEIQNINDIWVVNGVGLGGLSSPKTSLDMGNSGTGVRLIMGVVAPYEFNTTFVGDDSLQSRPMNRVLNPLREMGCDFTSSDNGRLPITIKGSQEMFPISYKLPVASAQVKSCIMMAALNIPGETIIIEPTKTRDHSEKMISYLGGDVVVEPFDEGHHITDDKNTGNEITGNKITITGQKQLIARDINIPADPSSAAFLVVAALITPNSEVTINNVMINPLRAGLFDVLQEMNADITFSNRRIEAGEEIADIIVKYSKLHGVDVPANKAPSMIDEYPILAVAASFAEGETIMRGLGELRVKESDRLSAVANGLSSCGVKNIVNGDDLTVFGEKNVLGDGYINTNLDHRIAMAFLVMGLASDKPIVIDDASVMDTSFPNFVELINKIGGDIN